MVSDEILREFVMGIVGGDGGAVIATLNDFPELARARFQRGATRAAAGTFFIQQAERYIVIGDRALHFAAAAYQVDIVRSLIGAGADVHAKNRFGDEPLHAASAGRPNAPRWNPAAQVATIECLIKGGADPNAVNKRGVAPLHVAVRTRCADAVRVLLDHGADPARRNINGSTSLTLARLNSGRAGTGLAGSKTQQQEILRLLEVRLSPALH